MKILTLENGKSVPAREFSEKLSQKTKEKLLRYIVAMEKGSLVDGPLVSAEGPGRFIVSVPNEDNLLVEYILFSEDEPTVKPEGNNPRLLFYPIDIHTWNVPEHIFWVGRPGEQVLVLPNEVELVLEDIRAGKRTDFASLNSEGVFEIFIPGKNIRGTAVWRT